MSGLDGAARDLVEKISEIDPQIFNIEFKELEGIRQETGGNFGDIFKATWFGAEVAVKRLLDVDDKDMHKYIEREMAVLSEMRHPNIVQLLGLCKHSTGVYIITEWVPGGDLRKLLKDANRPLTWLVRARMAKDTANAMAFVHSRGAVHRDLKSNNLLVGETWNVKVCDFGFSRDVNREEYMTLCGTDQWMAPEVMLGDKYDEKADVFSFAMVVTELITRKKPVPRLPGRAFAFDFPAFEKLIPADCPPELVRIVEQCSEFYPEKRPTMRELLPTLKNLVLRLQEAERQSGVHSPPTLSQTLAGITVSGNAKPPQPAATAPKRPTLRMRAIRDNVGKDEDELSFKKGDIMVAIAKDDTGWIKGILNGKEGWFPAESVEIVTG